MLIFNISSYNLQKLITVYFCCLQLTAKNQNIFSLIWHMTKKNTFKNLELMNV